jgi:hypothetical protein
MEKEIRHIACLKKEQRGELAKKAPEWLMKKLAEMPCSECGAELLVGPNAQRLLNDMPEYKVVCNDCAKKEAFRSGKAGRDILIMQMPRSEEEKGN